jgi:hypothetical protein
MRLLRNAVGRRGCTTRFQVRAGISAKNDEPITAPPKIKEGGGRTRVHELQNVSMALPHFTHSTAEYSTSHLISATPSITLILDISQTI